MKNVVCIKQVPDTTDVRIDPKTNTLMREGYLLGVISQDSIPLKNLLFV